MGKIVSLYERPSGTNSVREPKFDCTWLQGYRDSKLLSGFPEGLTNDPVYNAEAAIFSHRRGSL
jgi:hypothetical protein